MPWRSSQAKAQGAEGKLIAAATLESGDVYPHSSTLNKLAAAHDLPAAEYVRQLAALVSDAA